MHEIRYTQWRRQAGGTGARALWSLRTHANFADLTQDGFHFWMNLSPQTSKHVRHEPVPPPEQNSGDATGYNPKLQTEYSYRNLQLPPLYLDSRQRFKLSVG